jgi:hypothetical protein
VTTSRDPFKHTRNSALGNVNGLSVEAIFVAVHMSGLDALESTITS